MYIEIRINKYEHEISMKREHVLPFLSKVKKNDEHC
jgi:hypothetical protein